MQPQQRPENLTTDPIAAIALRIRQSLNLEEILNTTAAEVRQLLKCDRVLIYRFQPDWSGTVIVESVEKDWIPILGTTIHDPCFENHWIEPYLKGRIKAINDIRNSNLKACHIDLLAKFQVAANLVLPILQKTHSPKEPEKLWGLLIAHQCSAPRNWQEFEINFLQQLAVHVAIAIQQAELHQQLETELKERKNAESALQKLNEELEIRVLERTAQLSQVNDQLRLEIAYRQGVERSLLESQICLRLINTISNSRTSGLSVNQIINGTLKQIHKFFPNLRVAYSSIDEQYQLKLIQGIPSADTEEENSQVFDFQTTPDKLKEILKGEPIIVDDINKESSPDYLPQFLSKFPTQAYIAIPLRTSNKILGLLSAGCEKYHRWSEYEIATFIEIADYLSSTLQEAFAETKRQVAEQALQKLNEELENRIQERTAQLRETNKQLLEEIAERRRVETELAKSEERYRAVSELISDYAYALQLNEDGKIVLEWSAGRFGESFELNYTETIFWHQKIHPEDVLKLQKRHDKFFAGEADVCEYRVIDNNGDVRWLRDYTRPVEFNRDTKTLLLYGAAQDITAHRLASEALQKSEEQFRLFFENAPIGITLSDVESYKLIQINPAFCEMLGYSLEELQNRSVQDISDPEYWSLQLPLIQNLYSGEISTLNLETKYLKKNGHIVWANLTITLIQDAQAKPLYFLAMVENITERKQVEERLYLLESVVVNANDAIVITKPETIDPLNNTIVYVNQGFTRMTGYTSEEAIGKTPKILQGLNTDRQALNRIRTALLTSNSIQEELINYRKDQSQFWVELNIVPIVNERGILTNWVAIQRDITERKKAEDKIKISLEEKEVLLKEIHHRVKNNLQVISSLLSLQSRLISDPQAIQMFADSQNRILSIALIHEQLYQSPDLGRINFNDYIQQLAQQLLASYGSRAEHIKLTLQVEPVLINIETAMPCGLVITELVSNSLKYAFLEKTKGEISIECKSLGNDLFLLRVADNGVGLPEEINLKTTKSLGLRLVANLTRQLKAEITMDRKGGTSYSFRFSELKYKGRL